MRGAIETTELPAIRSAWQQVFRSNNPFEWPFLPELTVGRIFYPTDGYHLTRRQYLEVIAALKQTSETGFFLSVVESEGLSFLERSGGHWACEGLSYQEYSQLPLALEQTPFKYFHEGVWKTSFYDPSSRVFIGSINGELTTVINRATPQYVANLMRAAPLQ